MRRIKKWLSTALCILIVAGLPCGIYGFTGGISGGTDGEPEDRTLSPYFFVEGDQSSADQFPLKETHVNANINGTIADIYVTQVYANNGSVPINASYVFPASTKVSVHGMTMEIGDNRVIAKIKEREEAKAEFEQAKTEGKSASLLEEQRPNVFTMNVANIMPGDTVRIELHYTELIDTLEGTSQFVFPTVVGPRYSNKPADTAADADKFVSAPYLKDGKTPPGIYDITVNLSTGVPVNDIKSTSHKIKVEQTEASSAKVTLADKEDYAGNRDFILDYRLTGQQIQSGLMLYKGEKENFFLLSVQPPERVKVEEIPGREYIFVLDVSGSMEGYPLDTAKSLIRDLVSHLRKTDKFNIVLFAGGSSVMSPSSVPATSLNIQNAINMIDQQDGGGGTELSPALERAIALPADENVSRSIVILTDGYIDCEKAIFDLIHKNIGKTNFFSFGIGSSVNRYLIDGIAKAGLGEPFVLTDPSYSETIAGLFRDYIQTPVLTDIKVQYEGFDAYDVEPPSLPTLFAQKPVTLFGKWRNDQTGTIRITGRTANGEFSQEIRVDEVEPKAENSAISYLWARSRIARISDYGFGDTEDQDVKKAVTELGLEYSMLTPYTSFIAVIEKIRNTEGTSKDVNQPLPLPLNVSNLAVGDPYTQGAEPELLVLLVCVLIIPVIVLIRRKNRTVTT